MLLKRVAKATTLPGAHLHVSVVGLAIERCAALLGGIGSCGLVSVEGRRAGVVAEDSHCVLLFNDAGILRGK